MVEITQNAALPSIVYIDENPDARADFFTDAYQSGRFSEIHVLPPLPDLDDMVEQIMGLQVNALISDFQLTEAGPVNYNGETLVEAILARRADFPCFIQTSFDEAALNAAEDVNRVYSKNPKAAAGGGRDHLLQRIVIQVERHAKRLAEWQAELDELLAIDRGTLTALQIERIVELDDALESNMGVDVSLPQQAKRDLLKSENLMGRQADLIIETEKLISDMRQALND